MTWASDEFLFEDEHFRREEWAAAYQNTEEFPEGFWLAVREGKIPEGLNGTYFRNGPGLFSHGSDKVAHPFDGHGLVASISFSQGKAFFRSRFVRTKEYIEETAASRILYKGTFGTLVPGGIGKNLLQIAPRNVANTGLLSSSSKCLAMFEAGQPYSLDPSTLETKGVDLLGGSIKAGAPFSSGWGILDFVVGYLMALLSLGNNLGGYQRVGGDAVCAHPVQDPTTGNEVLFSFRLQLGLVAWNFLLFGYAITLWLPGLVTKLSVREFSQDLQQVSVVHQTLCGYSFLHDLSITPSKYVIFQNPVRLRMLRLLLGTLCPAHCICWTGQPPKIHLIQRPNSCSGIADLPLGKPSSGHRSVQLQAVCSGKCQEDSVQQGRWSEAGGPDPKDKAKQLEMGCNPHIARGRAVAENLASSTDADVAAISCSSTLEVSTAGSAHSCHVDPAFVFHQANAFELDDGQTVVVDCIRYPTMPDFQQASSSGSFLEAVDPELQPISQLWRYHVNVSSGRLTARMLSSRAMEFPAINPSFTGQSHRYIYASAARHPFKNMPQQALAKVDVQTNGVCMWSRSAHLYVGEPVFVPQPGGGACEDEGWILSVCYDAVLHSSECIILEAASMELLASIPLGHVLPHGLHGAWDPVCRL